MHSIWHFFVLAGILFYIAICYVKYIEFKGICRLFLIIDNENFDFLKKVCYIISTFFDVRP